MNTTTEFINNDTTAQINKYIDTICSNPSFLCKNRELCGTSTTIYTSVDNVNNICENIKKASKCDNDFKECLVSVKNTFDDAEQLVATSFVNIILPIPNAIDEFGNQKFLRLPALSGHKKEKSDEICSICSCISRFAKSPGDSDNGVTSPGQNECIYEKTFEYYYYPINIEFITTKLKDTPEIKLGKYKIVNTNIIYAHSEEDLIVSTLYSLLLKNNISEFNTKNFILNVLYKDDKSKEKELDLYLINKKEQLNMSKNKFVFINDTSFFYILFVFMIILLYRLKK
jgi:hypothetical protein